MGLPISGCLGQRTIAADDDARSTLDVVVRTRRHAIAATLQPLSNVVDAVSVWIAAADQQGGCRGRRDFVPFEFV